MRLALPLLLILFVVSLFMFALTNDARVDVALGGTTFRSVHLTIVVLVSLVAGVVFTGVLALIEGASTRLTNRRLRRRMEKLETEIQFLKTQASDKPRVEPDAIEADSRALQAVEAEERWRQGKLPSAPVYDPDAPAEQD
jgi:uncharacterized integral membrane protein